MSLATRCTHCGTIFKVVEDQLKVSEGWVRCGRCNEVFNAMPTLFDLEKEPPPPRVTAPPQPEHAPEPTTFEAPLESPPTHQQPEFEQAAAHSFAAPAVTAPQPSIPAPPTSDSSLPSPTERTSAALSEHSLLATPDVQVSTDTGIDSQLNNGWPSTQPASLHSQFPREDLEEGALTLEPPPIEGTTDFELDTSIAVDDNTPLEDVLASVAPGRARVMHEPVQPTTTTYAAEPAEPAFEPLPVDEAPESVPPARRWTDMLPEELPSTAEEDALDSRYLMPSDRERKAPRRREEGPEFMDAQFPTDAFLDAEEDWASDFGPSALDADAPVPVPPPVQILPEAEPPAALATGLRAAPPVRDDGAGAAAPASPSFTSEQPPPESTETPSGKRKKGRKKSALADGEAAAPTPEFLKRAQRKAFWRHPAMRATLSITVLVLLLGLGLQVVHQFRDLVAAYHPATRPWLTQWCDIAGCTLAPPLRLEDLQVESATLVRATSEGPDSYRLAVVVHNKAGIDLAWPHVDLTLTDDNGAVIARRVFSPQDAQWLDTADPKADAPAGAPHPVSPSASTPTAAPHQRSTTLQWRLLAPDIKPAGYTAELFYP